MSKVYNAEQTDNLRKTLLDQMPTWTQTLDEAYQKKLLFPMTEGYKYDNIVSFCKGFGYKILRNNQGHHKLEIRQDFVDYR